MENPSFRLEGVVHEKNELQDFEGPLSLILMLLSKNKIEIRDIRISEILDQYLAYLAEMESMDLEIASEFVQMAAHLLYIKTRTLLAAEEEVSELEVLMESLEQLKAKDNLAAIRQILPEMKTASDTGLLYFPKLPEPLPKRGKSYEYRHEPVELLQAILNVTSRSGHAAEPEDGISRAIPKRIIYSVQQKSRQLIDRLRAGSASLRELYTACETRSEVVATFLSILELCSMGCIHIAREDEGYTVSFVGGDVQEILERIGETQE